ncbi:hypothetical protein ACHAXT_007990 [Thalassiosira profunda]
MSGPGSGGGPRPVANPYLKRAPGGGGRSGGSGGAGAPTANKDARPPKQKMVHAASAVKPTKGASMATPAAAKARNNGAQATPKVTAHNNPYPGGAGGARPRVTPTPKKARHNTTAPPATAVKPAPNSAACAAIYGARLQHPKPPVARRTGSLKSQLKSQIAALARQKKQFLLQKELEKQRLVQQKEMERQRIVREKELKRQAKLREKQRLKQEEETRKQLVGKCVADMVTRVEKRAVLEETTGVHFAIGEAVEDIIRSVEERAAAEAKEEKEDELRRHREEAAAQKLQERLLQRMPASVAPPAPVAKPAAPRKPTPPSAKAAMELHHSPLTNPHSPFAKSHHVLSSSIIMTKEKAGDSFGVTLRYESKSALVPLEVDEMADAFGGAMAALAPMEQRKKNRRKRVDFGVVMVVNADQAKFSGMPLQPGDIILSANGHMVNGGGMTFALMCKAIGATSSAWLDCRHPEIVEEFGVSCYLRVARANVVPNFVNPTLWRELAKPTGMAAIAAQNATAAVPMIPSHYEFSMTEWAAVIQGLSTLPHRLCSGMALMPVNQKDVLDAIKKSGELGPNLSRRTIEAMETKVARESKRIMGSMIEKAGQYWASKWAAEPEQMTDAKRSKLRGAARPFKGCKCGSSTHERVDHPDCPLYADVRRYCLANSITIQADEAAMKKSPTKEYKTKSAMEQAYVDRFRQQRAESAADKKEAAFVLEMEMIQSSKMKKAVFAPSSLCTMVLSAVASMAEMETPSQEVAKEQSDSDSNDDSDSDDDVPLTSLQAGGNKRVAAKPNSPAAKRPKPEDTKSDDKKKAAPSTYILAELLKRISETHGHLFAELEHSEYAWQQRHRSTLTTPLPKEVMFRDSPRTPGKRSYENVRFLLDGERMSRLRQVWLNLAPQPLPNPASQPDKDTAMRWNDEWIVAHLSSDATTGLRHEINVLVGLDILSVSTNGGLSLAKGWEKRVPQMVLNELRDEWGRDADGPNLHCIHGDVWSALHAYWERDEDGWIGGDEIAFDDDEYELRKEIFTENCAKWAAERSGQGNFGV